MDATPGWYAAGPGGGIGAETGVAEVLQLRVGGLDGMVCGCFSGFQSPEQTALEGLRLGTSSGARH